MSHSHYGHYYSQESLSQEECEVWRKLHGSVRTVQAYSIVMVSVGRIHWSINFARAHTQKHSPTHTLLIASHFFQPTQCTQNTFTHTCCAKTCEFGSGFIHIYCFVSLLAFGSLPHTPTLMQAYTTYTNRQLWMIFDITDNNIIISIERIQSGHHVACLSHFKYLFKCL